MCLHIKYERKSGRKTGYKLLYQEEWGSLITGYCDAKAVYIRKTGYTTDPNHGNLWSNHFSYPAGFHTFLTKRSAEKIQRLENFENNELVLCKVAFKDEVAYGRVKWYFHGEKDFLTSTVVARKCKVLHEV